MRSRPLVWSLVLIMVVTFGALAATAATRTTPLLGLDLKGGVSVVEQPQGKVTSASLQESVNIIDRRVDSLGVSNAQVTVQGKDVDIELPGAKNDTQILKIVGQTAQLFFRPVLCEIEPYLPAITSKTKTSTGTTTTTTPATAKTSTTTAKTSTTTGTANSTSTTKPAHVTPNKTTTSAKAAADFGRRPAVDLSGAVLTSSSHRLDAAGKTSEQTTTTAASKATTTTTASGKTTTTTTVPTTTTTTNPVEGACNLSQEQQLTYMPPHGDNHGDTSVSYDTKNAYVVLPFYASYKDPRYVLGPAEMSGSVVKSAQAELNSQNDEWQVDISFTGSGTNQFNKYAAEHYACYEEDTKDPPYCAFQAIELDATVYSAPSIDASSFDTGATISGSFTSQQASNLALELNYGSLPVRFVPQTISTVSPQIGTASLKAGAVAGGVAVLLVLLYLIVYYRALGLVVVLGICMSGALLYSITDLLSQTEDLALTLSGVIGLIVSVGITADSCVVYFERLKEEIRSGRTVRTSVEKGFNRAFRTILAADFSSFVAALILYTLTVGDVRGFAFFLGLATLLNVVTTYFFTRPLVIMIGRRATMSANAGFLGVSRGLGAGPVMP